MIRDSMFIWQAATERLIDILNIHEEEKRESILSEVSELIAKRDVLQQDMFPPFSSEEQQFGKELILLDQRLKKELAEFNRGIRQNITYLQKKKDTSHAYTDPYSQVFRDGTFYDKKK